MLLTHANDSVNTSLDEWNEASSQAHDTFASSPEETQRLRDDIDATVTRSVEQIPNERAENFERTTWKKELSKLLIAATSSNAEDRKEDDDEGQKKWSPDGFGAFIRTLYDPKDIIRSTSRLA